ncbi:hypothetical protein GH714_042009 [Hevea brasiliensis]|uniref:Inositol polyphosphate-related phosphatase domain-containing protein n=1 Tax=Hevea brasiliensis TaxID=3981 RepID=A0A6A6MW88_HEVBR|nr:hypothetical protein GH714_042009 [Hevea brasiliensis]
MWPRLVANKILRKRLGSNNFVADFPSNKEVNLLEIPNLVRPSLSADRIYDHQKDTHNYKVFVSTWNVGGIAPSEDLDMADWLDTPKICDIYVLGHLASGGKEGDEKHRNSDVAEILSRTSFPRGPSLDLPRKILDHDRVILLGDLNYRISLPEETTRLLVNRKEWNALLENDQLRMELMTGQAFEGWHEGIIKFAPTYKYCPNSNVYFGCLEGKKSEKCRAPAWCDRIIWYGEGLKQHLYGRGEAKLSDHRPVKAIFSAEVEVLQTLKGLQNFFLSERFDQITNKFDMPSSLKFLCNGRLSLRI